MIKDFTPLDAGQLKELADFLKRVGNGTVKAPVNPQITDDVTQDKLKYTFGQKLVGLTFNPSNDAKVQRAKELCAELADLVRNENEVLHIDNSVKHHLLHHTYGEILNAQMNVVKVLTLKY